MAETTWEEEVLSLKAQGLSSTEIASAVDKHPATVRKVIARAGDTTGTAPSNGNGNGHVDAETAERLRDAAGLGEPIEGQTDLSDFIAEAGEAVGPMPPREMDAGETVHVEEIRVDGSTQLALDCGGRLADESKLTLSGSASVRGFFKKGDRITGTFEAVVDGVGSKDKYDKQTGVIKDTAQSHSARITDMTIGWRN
jgi:hypothetical protein